MTPEQYNALLRRLADLEYKLNDYAYPDRYQFKKNARFDGLKLGFFKAPVAAQPSTTGSNNVVINGGSTINTLSASKGYTNAGSAYTISDIVGALKILGILAP